MKKCLLAICLLCFSLFMTSCGKKTDGTTTVDTYDFSGNPLENENTKLNAFTYGDISIDDGLFKDTFDGCLEYYMSLKPEDILYKINRTIDPTCTTGKDINVGPGGNVLGQWMQAYSRFYDATKDENVLKQCKEIMQSMNQLSIQSPFLLDSEYSYYCFEKYLRGFLDMYTYCGISEGYDCAKRMMDAALVSESYKNPRLSLGDNGGDQEIEWYTLVESILRFWEVSREDNKVTGKELNEYYDFAKKFIYKDFYDIFVNGKNLYDYSPEHGINTQYFHAYSHVNSLNSAAALYKKTGDEYYLDAMVKFYDWLYREQELTTGGFGCHTEWLCPREKQISYLQQYHDNFETQCNCYAMYRLGGYLMQYTGKASYGDWTEKLLYNGTIASLETNGGFAYYYSDYSSSGGSKALKTNWKWSCCTGTRPLSVLEILRSIYFNDTNNIYVNLFTNSEVNWVRDNDYVKLSQKSNYPTDNSIMFTVNTDRTDKFAVKIRNSKFASENIIVKVNGEAFLYKVDSNGWIDINRVWSDNDKIEIIIPMTLTTSFIEEELDYGVDGVWALEYGPISLAAKLPLGIKPTGLIEYETILTEITKGSDNLHYSLVKDGINVEYKPFYEYEQGEAYYIYINKYNYNIFG